MHKAIKDDFYQTYCEDGSVVIAANVPSKDVKGIEKQAEKLIEIQTEDCDYSVDRRCGQRHKREQR